jgi:outer membrane usher protein FimD/PapC
MKLSFRTYQQQLPGYTSLALAIAYTDGVVDEKQISRAIQLGIDNVIRSISQSVTSNAGSRQVDGQQRVAQECAERNQMDEILEQILCESLDGSTV